MDATIELTRLKRVVDAFFEHLSDTVGVREVIITPSEDFYWTVTGMDLWHDMSRTPDPDVGKLSEDWEWVRDLTADSEGMSAAMLMHLAPLLRFVGEKVGR